uniref:Uncharacterized protein n=1 Tax=Oryza meridionalis TaxID=40149 RepID=A0A0E0CN70_9ORYZ
MVHNLVLEDMAPKVVELVVFHIEPLKQRIFLLRGNPQKFEWEEEKEILRVGL